MPDLQALRKPREPIRSGSGYDDLLRDFIGLVMAKLLSREFQDEYVFSTHPTWKNGRWRANGDDPTPAVAIATSAGGLVAAIEVETARTLDDPEAPRRWSRLARLASLDLVVPKKQLTEAKAKADAAGVRVHEFWSYAINASSRVFIAKESASSDGLIEAERVSTDIVVY